MYIALVIYIIKRDMFVCLLPKAGRTAGPIKTKLGISHYHIGTLVDPGSDLVQVKVIYRGPQGRDNSVRRMGT